MYKVQSSTIVYLTKTYILVVISSLRNSVIHNHSLSSFPSKMWHTILAWIWIALPEVWGNHESLKKVNSPFEVEVPSKEPTFHGVNSSFIFKSIGTLYPTISYVHVRGTINTSVIEEMVETVCDRSERIENFFMAYSKGKLSHMHAEILQR